MAERASALERVQVAAEATAGVAVAAATRLLMTMIRPDPNVPIQRHKGAGRLYNSAVSTGYEQTEAALEGVGDGAGYNDLVPLLSAHLKTAAYSSNTATFTPAVEAANTIKTLSVEVGQALLAEKFNYGVVRDLVLRFTRQSVNLSGAMFGRALGESATLSTVTATLNPIPIGANEWEVYLGTSADLSDLTLLDRVFDYEFRSNGRWAPLFAANTSQASYAAPVELAPDTSIRLALEHNSTAAGYMAQLRAGSTRYLRLKAFKGNVTSYSVQIDCPVQFVDSNRNDVDGVAASEYILEPVYNASFASGAALRIAVVSDLTAW